MSHINLEKISNYLKQQITIATMVDTNVSISL